MAPEPVLGYWSIRGLAQSLRYILAHAGVQFTDKQYTFGDSPNYERSDWKDEKESLGLEFPNLPYYIEGDVKITESLAIGKHLGRKHNLVGSTENELVKLDMAEGIIFDIARTLVMLSYDPEFETKKTAFIQNADASVTKMSKLVGSGNYIIGDKITWTDFILFETLERYLGFIPTCLDNHPNLQAYHKRILELPNIKKYRNSPTFQKIKSKFNGPMAKFGGGN